MKSDYANTIEKKKAQEKAMGQRAKTWKMKMTIKYNSKDKHEEN